MFAVNAAFEVLKNEAGETIGLSLLAQADADSEEFCRNFPRAFRYKKADIKFDGEKILFVLDDDFCKGIFTHKIDSTAEISSLQEILKSKEGKKARRKQKGRLKIKITRAFSPGFEITI